MPTAKKRQTTPEKPVKNIIKGPFGDQKGHYTFETGKMGLEKADFRHVAEQRFPDDAIRVKEYCSVSRRPNDEGRRAITHRLQSIIRAAEEGAVRVGKGVEDAKEAEFKKKEEEYAFDL
ncbi:hypothetical protein CDEST_03253 [Colletotrichum destructivum]|uniref:Uncharacterized protein n=1 Tax=Colletotrichum destructivum TaxID=34406 RepID=A0AAX4I4P7_9PEZI|nr:hypothetical protein CDEST_03253 [Colletotrichum destructivum]